MELKEIKKGQFFTIGNTPSYPKLRTDYGYIDVRDEIKIEELRKESVEIIKSRLRFLDSAIHNPRKSKILKVIDSLVDLYSESYK